MNQKSFLILSGLLFLIIYSSTAQKPDSVLSIGTYSSYNNSTLPTDLSIDVPNQYWNLVINKAMLRIGLPASDIEIATTAEFGAFSAINRRTFRRFLVYGPTFFAAVHDADNSDYAILSICFHELAHLMFNHPLKSSATSLMFERQADRYSGYYMAIAGASLDQSLFAMKNFGNTEGTSTHPSKTERLKEIKKGFTEARIEVFKDSTFSEVDSILRINEIILAVQTSSKNKVSASITGSYKNLAIKRPYKKLFNLLGQLIYITRRNKIKLLADDQTIGKMMPGKIESEKTLVIGEVNYFLTENGQIYSTDLQGTRLNVGQKLN